MSRPEDRCTEAVSLVIHALLYARKLVKRFDSLGFFYRGFAAARQLIEQTAFDYVRATLVGMGR